MFYRLRLGDGDRGRTRRLWFCGRYSAALDALTHQIGNGIVQRTGVSLLLRDAEFRQHFEDRVRGDLELPGQLIDTNLAHKHTATLYERGI